MHPHPAEPATAHPGFMPVVTAHGVVYTSAGYMPATAPPPHPAAFEHPPHPVYTQQPPVSHEAPLPVISQPFPTQAYPPPFPEIPDTSSPTPPEQIPLPPAPEPQAHELANQEQYSTMNPNAAIFQSNMSQDDSPRGGSPQHEDSGFPQEAHDFSANQGWQQGGFRGNRSRGGGQTYRGGPRGGQQGYSNGYGGDRGGAPRGGARPASGGAPRGGPRGGGGAPAGGQNRGRANYAQ